MRNQDGVITFTLKRSIKNELDSVEHEVRIDNIDEARSIIEELGYVEHSFVEKKRSLAKLPGGITICLDSVASLGDFIELEMTSEDAHDHDDVAGQLWKLANSLGVEKADEVKVG